MFSTDLRTYAPKIEPTLSFPLDTQYCGKWLVAGDLTGEGRLDFVSGRSESQAITSMAAYRQDGTLLWTWGEPGSGSSGLCSDLPLQLFEPKSNGKCSVIFGIKNYILLLDGTTGEEITRYPLPEDLEIADCITFGNLSTKIPGEKTDIIIKNRYWKLWAYTADWDFLWSWKPKNGIQTCHHPTPVDINNDGYDEILVGNEMLDREGKTLWEIQSRYARKKGHLDCAQIVVEGPRPEDFRIVFSYCGQKYLAMMDGTGHVLWEQHGKHFESIDVGTFNRGNPSPKFYADIEHSPFGAMEGVFMDFRGKIIGTCKYDTGRFHRCVDWNGDGLDEVVVGTMLALVDGNGQKIGTFQFNGQREETNIIHRDDPEPFLVSILDLTGKGNGDIVLHDASAVNIYLNPSMLTKTQKRFDDMNFTLY